MGAQLVQCALAGDPSHVLQTAREPIALALELCEAEQPGAAQRFARHGSGVG